MNKKIMMVLALVLAFSLPAWAEHGEKCSREDKMKCDMAQGCDKQKSQCPIVAKIMKKSDFYLNNASELGLSDDQVEKIKAIQTSVKKDEINANAQMQIAMIDLEEKMKSDPVDVAGLNSMIDGMSAGMASGAKKSVQTLADLKAVLTDEQKAKAKEIWKANS